MIDCNFFCIAEQERVDELLQKVSKVKRFKKELRKEEVRISGKNFVVLYYYLGGEGASLVHGITEGGMLEYVSLSLREGTVSRDIAGTRSAYITAHSVSTDHRLNDGSHTLLPRNSTYDILTGKIRQNKEEKIIFDTMEDAITYLKNALDESVKKRAMKFKKVCVSFSGGLDSSLIAFIASKYSSVLLLSAFTKGSYDMDAAEKSAELLDLPFTAVNVSDEDVRNEIASIQLPFEPSLMDKALYVLYSIVARKASELGYECLFLGQLADELFGGYMKYQRALIERDEETVRIMMQNDLDSCAKRGLVRDEIACSRWLVPCFPFSERKVYSAALSVPVSYKVSLADRKIILREVARELCIDERLVESKKKAAQYSTGIQKIVSKFSSNS